MTSSWFFGSMNQRSMISMSSMKSTIAARFLSINDLRAAQMMNCETPMASLLVNSGARDLLQLGVER